MTRSHLLLMTGLGVISFSLSAPSFSQAPDSISYQAYVEEAGVPLNATHELTFRLYDDAAATTALWTETHPAVSIVDGVYSVVLGDVVSLAGVGFDQPLWLGVAIGDQNAPELSPRTLIASAPYALFANHADTAAPSGSAAGDLTGAYPDPTVSGIRGRFVSTAPPSIGHVLKWVGSEWAPQPDLEGAGSQWLEDGPNIYYTAGNVGVGGPPDPLSELHVKLPSSGEFANLQIQSPSTDEGFGMLFTQPAAKWYVGQNIGNWDDGRFQIAEDESDKWLTILPNGNVGLTQLGFTTPIARLQVPPLGDLDDSPSPNVTKSALYIGFGPANGLAFDMDQIESLGAHLRINSASEQHVLLGGGGGNVGVNVHSAAAPFHVGEDKTVLFGADTLGKTSLYPDAKLMFLAGKGGAFRVGELRADGSLPEGTGYDYWDTPNVGWASVAIGNNTKATGTASVALGIRGYASNFGSVAIGHLARTKGNSAVAAGYYTRADAFVSAVVGAGNVGGGNANVWINSDPIFEVGNSVDTTARSNALTVLKNGRVAINHANPRSMLDIEQPNSGQGSGVLLNLDGIGHWETGVDNAADYNFYFNNSLKAYILDTDGTFVSTSDRRLKTDIQDLQSVLDRVARLRPSSYRMLASPTTSRASYGFIAQDVENVFPEIVFEKDGLKALPYDTFGVLAIKAIQELQAIVDTQSNRIQELEERIADLEVSR